jgi:hypothetical protein
MTRTLEHEGKLAQSDFVLAAAAAPGPEPGGIG